MAAEEKNQLLFVDRTKIDKLLEDIKEENKEYTDTIQVQVSLRGLDPRRDNKITKDITMPYKSRYLSKTIVLADKDTGAICEEKGIPFVLIDDLMQDKMITEKKKIFKSNKYFILCKGSNKVFQTKIFLRAGKIPYMLKDDDKVDVVYNNALKMYRMRVKDMSVTSFPVGHTKMDNNEIFENIKHGLTIMTAALKKGEENIKNVFLKGAQRAPKKLY
ncbi:hypothetical protein NCER_100300 [Vairimorpha ceranae BRL01]|uniref:60s ribosomal protein l10a n=2 Tax=Vairimorpha ceranae TaxID=40302 RepID=C4V778_VAIC1|nr:60s ribosomal protein l10a [Vairimorpha ceranae]EEQ82932.1 hypothetical protein NCER_100300 [Vairimorpha ceranae BRL01]KAF5140916.1 hypothetical protein G9O61_00g009060 [Vairimorpha ceranae]KKO75785.1 60s ribosomal protein l10a [Vairimorpha ceranae]